MTANGTGIGGEAGYGTLGVRNHGIILMAQSRHFVTLIAVAAEGAGIGRITRCIAGGGNNFPGCIAVGAALGFRGGCLCSLGGIRSSRRLLQIGQSLDRGSYGHNKGGRQTCIVHRQGLHTGCCRIKAGDHVRGHCLFVAMAVCIVQCNDTTGDVQAFSLGILRLCWQCCHRDGCNRFMIMIMICFRGERLGGHHGEDHYDCKKKRDTSFSELCNHSCSSYSKGRFHFLRIYVYLKQ